MCGTSHDFIELDYRTASFTQVFHTQRSRHIYEAITTEPRAGIPRGLHRRSLL